MAEEITGQQGTDEGTEPEKTFTQDEVDRIVANRLAREKKGMPSAEELEKFRNWQSTQQTEAEKLGTVTKERDTANKELEDARRENILLRMGVSVEDVDYYAFKIAKLVTDKKDFEAAAKEFIKERKPKKSTVTFEMGTQHGGGSGKTSTNDVMNKLIRGE